MASQLTRDIYRLLSAQRPVTAAGVCYLMRGADIAPLFGEAERSLEWLTRNGYAERTPGGECGPEYLKRASV